MDISALSSFNLYLQQTYTSSSARATDGSMDFAKITALNPIEDMDTQSTNVNTTTGITSGISALDAFNASKAGSFTDILTQLVDASQVQGTATTGENLVIPQQTEETTPIEATQGSAGSSAASDSGESESESTTVTTQVITNPDGSRQLEITTKSGNTETVTTMQLSTGQKPTEFQSTKAMNAYESNFMYATA